MDDEKIEYNSNDKMVTHPSHYQGANGKEAWDFIEAFTADLTGIEAVDTANILKYACIWKKKTGLQDIEKIIQTATHLFNYVLKTYGKNPQIEG